MIETILRFAVDLDRGVQREPIRPALLTQDEGAHTFQVHCKRGGANEDLTGSTVRGYFVRADSATIIIDGQVSGSVASVTLPSACYTVPGRCQLVMKLLTGDTVSTIFFGDGAVSVSQTDTIVDEEHIIPSLDDILQQIEAVEAAAQAANAAADNANTAAGAASTAASGANSAASAANTAAQSANTQAATAQAAAQKIDGMTVSAQTLAAGAQATATVTEAGGAKVISFGIPQGIKGDKGDTGAKGDKGDPGNVSSVNGVQPDASGDVKIPYAVNPNLLDNPYFVGGSTGGRFPINRNGKSVYTTNGISINRWQRLNQNVSITENGVTCEAGAWFAQRVPNLERLHEKTLTFSVLTVDNMLYSGTITGQAFGSSILYFFANNNIELCYFGDFGFGFNVRSSMTFVAAKLELGDTQTLAHQENGEWVLNGVPNYAEELTKCMQYDSISGEYVGMNGLTPPKNLLDNSDFSIAQVGYGGMHGNLRYAADRWVEIQGNTAAYAAASGGGMVANFTDSYTVLIQVVKGMENLLGKEITFAVYTEEQGLYITSGVLDTGGLDVYAKDGLYIGTSGGYREVAIVSDAAKTVTIRWAALYEGVYTSDTLPAYVSKDYAAELAECKMDFERLYLHHGFLLSAVKDNSLAANIQYAKKRISAPTITCSSVFPLRKSDDIQVYPSPVVPTAGQDLNGYGCTLLFNGAQTNPVSVGEYAYVQGSDSYIDISADL